MEEIPGEIVSIHQETKKIPERNTTANYELFFQAKLSPLERRILVIRNDTDFKPLKNQIDVQSKNTVVLKNAQIKLLFDSTGSLFQVNNLKSNISSSIIQKFSVYNSFIGNNSESDFQASGAYIFRPQSDIPSDLTVKGFSVYRGELFEEIHQIYNDWISQTIRLYKDDSVRVEFEWQVGPIDVEDKIGKEVVLRFESDLKSDSLFYTDSNGREILQRKRDTRYS